MMDPVAAPPHAIHATHAAPPPHAPAAAELVSSRAAIWMVAVIMLVAGVATAAASLRTSTTFDEIVMMAGGARGFAGGGWDLVPEHPPLVQYIYGLPVHLAAPALPDESGVTPEMRRPMVYRYNYAQQMFWGLPNDPERLARLGRIPAILMAVALIGLAALYARGIAGNAAAVITALLVASLPDVLGHGGVAYNDVPLALLFLASVWALHVAMARPSVGGSVLAGVLVGLALAVKNSAVALAPIAVLLLLVQCALRWRDRDWRRKVAPGAVAALAAIYLTLVLVYRGDFLLDEYRAALRWAFGHVTQLPVPAFLLGEVRVGGWWYFFPLAFLYKTSAGLHLLVAAAIGILLRDAVRDPSAAMRSPLLPPAVAVIVFAVLLLASDLNIGFRYALPALPLLCIIAAAGATRLWVAAHRRFRALILVAALWPALHVGAHYPFFLSYLSEYGPGQEDAHTILADSSLDWGQGLLELRRFMADNGVPAVWLSYFGSAHPAGYGIRYLPLPSYMDLPWQPVLDRDPEWVAISATNLTGTYFEDDPFARFRNARPDHVIARSIYLYRVGEDGVDGGTGNEE
jgi:hypothetical protein